MISNAIRALFEQHSLDQAQDFVTKYFDIADSSNAGSEMFGRIFETPVNPDKVRSSNNAEQTCLIWEISWKSYARKLCQ